MGLPPHNPDGNQAAKTLAPPQVRKIVGIIRAEHHRGWVRMILVANTGEVLGIDLDAVAAVEFLEGLEAALKAALHRRLRS